LFYPKEEVQERRKKKKEASKQTNKQTNRESEKEEALNAFQLLIIFIEKKSGTCFFTAVHMRGHIQKFQDWPPGVRTANGTALCH